MILSDFSVFTVLHLMVHSYQEQHNYSEAERLSRRLLSLMRSSPEFDQRDVLAGWYQ